MRTILKIENTKFIYFSDAVNYDPGESVIHLSRSEEKTGTVIYAAEVVDEYPDELIALGSEDGSNYALCVHEPFLKFQESWRASVLAVKSGGVVQPVEEGGSFMSKQECRPAYLRHKLAMEAAISKKDPPRVAEIFKRKPYAAANDLQKRRKTDEPRRDNE